MKISNEMQNRNNNNHSYEFRRAVLASVLLILMVSAQLIFPGYLLQMSPYEVYAESEQDKTEVVTGDSSSDGDNAEAESLPYTASGESVKCASDVLVDPIGDPDATAPDIRAKGATLYSYDLKKQVFGKNDNKRLDPYSTTKLLTCWLALENLDPEQVVTISAKATQVYENGTTIWLKEGEKIRVIDLMYGAMLESGNDAAYALGEAVSGSEKEFADLMNRTVEEWGCSDTHFVNANGWKNDDHYTTAHDMMIITARCLENEKLREITSTKKYTAPATNLSGEREMKNYFLKAAGYADEITGGKSGTWDDDDCGIVASFSSNGLNEVLVVLGDTKKGRTKDARTLIDFSHEVTPGYAVPASGSTVETAWLKHGERTRISLRSDGVTYAYPESNDAGDITTEVKYDKLEAPIAEGDEVGELLIYSDGNLIGEHKLIAAESIDTGWFPSYLYISNKASKIILAVIAVLTALVIAVMAMTRKKRAARRRLREKYRGKH